MNLSQIEEAVVDLPDMNGRGVFVADKYVVTAAHCINFPGGEGLALGDYVYAPVHTARRRATAELFAIEHRADIAVLGSPDEQDCREYAKEFDAFCESATSIPVATNTFIPFESFDVYIFGLDRTWIAGKAQICCDGAHILNVQAERRVLGGASGGPIVNERGELLAVISTVGDDPQDETCSMQNPLLSRTLPIWLWERIAGSMPCDE